MLELFLTFLKIGVVSFGGGYGMISVLSEEVISHGWLTESQLLNFIGIAESTPGPIAINMATFIGASQGTAVMGGALGGFLGAVLATFAVVLPAFIIILLIASVMRGLLKFAGVKAFLEGVRPVVVGLIVSTAINMFIMIVIGVSKVGDVVVFDWKSIVIFCLIAILSISVKKFAKINLSPIILILISAVLGILFFGVLGGI